MEIEGAGLLIPALNDFQILLEQRIGEKPEVASTAGRPVATDAAWCNRNFYEAAIFERIKGKAGLLGIPYRSCFIGWVLEL